MIRLTIRTELGSPQRNFEYHAVEHMKLNSGLFGITSDGKKYVNHHVQWLWVQYQRSLEVNDG